MMYNYAKLDDETQIACSNILEDSSILIAIERSVNGGFDSACCTLGEYIWREVVGFSDSELGAVSLYLRDNEFPIMQFARNLPAYQSLNCEGVSLP